MNPLIPVFEGKKIEAAGIAFNDKGNYTADMFNADFPQFTDDQGTSIVPLLDTFIEMANESVLPSVWGKTWRYAAGLFVAHQASLYLKTYRDHSTSPSEAVADTIGVVKTATMGDTSVSYDNSAVTAGTEKWGTWNATQYGAQLVTMARQIGIAGSYVV